MVFENAGVYRSFGDSRIIPALPADVFETIVKASPAYATDSSRALLDELWGAVGTAIFATSPRLLQLGMAPDAVTSYYSGDFTREDAALISRFVKSKGMLQPYNSRVFKVAAPASASGPGRKHYVMRLASAIKVQEASGAGAGTGTLTGRSYDDVEGHLMLGAHAFEDATIEIARGDMAPLMARVCGHLGEAQAHASSPLQVRMLSRYIDSFRTGSQEAHIDGSRLWTKDVGPTVESYIGFIESYRDPMGGCCRMGAQTEQQGLAAALAHVRSSAGRTCVPCFHPTCRIRARPTLMYAGVRGEWESFCAVVNKSMSAKFGKLVDEAESLLPLLPWGRQFEMDRFMRPDFTSLEVLAFGSSGIPADECDRASSSDCRITWRSAAKPPCMSSGMSGVADCQSSISQSLSSLFTIFPLPATSLPLAFRPVCTHKHPELPRGAAGGRLQERQPRQRALCA
jgi:dipeptidyl-peptidase-3